MWIAWLALLVCVVANTETLVFDWHGASVKFGGGLSPEVPYNSSFNFGEHERHELRVPPTAPPGRYFARVCWPASTPADLSLQFDGAEVVVTGSREEVVAVDPRAVAEVPYQLHLTAMKWGVLPEEVIPMIYGVATAFFVGCGAAYVFLNWVL